MTKVQAWVTYSTRILPELKERIDRYKRKTGKTYIAITHEAFDRYLKQEGF